MRPLTVILMLFLAWFPYDVANATRCGNAIVVEGDSSYRVRKKCGEPDLIERSVIYKTRAVHRGYRWSLCRHRHRLPTATCRQHQPLRRRLHRRP